MRIKLTNFILCFCWFVLIFLLFVLVWGIYDGVFGKKEIVSFEVCDNYIDLYYFCSGSETVTIESIEKEYVKICITDNDSYYVNGVIYLNYEDLEKVVEKWNCYSFLLSQKCQVN